MSPWRWARAPVCRRRLPLPLGAALLAALCWWALGDAALAQTRSYNVLAHDSAVQVVLRKEGLFSLLAHDHVMVADGFAGRVGVDPADVAKAALQLSFPVASLRVDPPEARAELGLEGKLDDGDRADIKENMLSPEQLDAAQYPRVIATLEGLSGQLPDLLLAVRVRIKKTEKVLSTPAHIELAGDRLLASGEFTFLQSDFGVEPYSSLLGAIAVQDEVRIRFRIVAQAEAG